MVWYHTNEAPIVQNVPVIGQEFIKPGDGIEDEEWDEMSTDDRNRFEMRALLEEKSFKIDTTPVEYVGYNERLYETLVGIGAAKGTRTQTGQVAIDAEGLGYPEGLLQ